MAPDPDRADDANLDGADDGEEDEGHDHHHEPTGRCSPRSRSSWRADLSRPRPPGLVRQDDPQRALEYLALVSILFRRLDDASVR